jgi:hypothetical protein
MPSVHLTGSAVDTCQRTTASCPTAILALPSPPHTRNVKGAESGTHLVFHAVIVWCASLNPGPGISVGPSKTRAGLSRRHLAHVDAHPKSKWRVIPIQAVTERVIAEGAAGALVEALVCTHRRPPLPAGYRTARQCSSGASGPPLSETWSSASPS